MFLVNKMRLIDMKKEINIEDIKDAASLIRDSKLVIFPTETVYGIGANGLDDKAVKNIFVAKGRESDNPLILHVSSYKMIERVARNINSIEKRLIDVFFPGPLTIILDKKDIVPSSVTAGLDTVGVRMPSNKIANLLIKYADVPIAAPSANASGKPSGTNTQDIICEFKDSVSCIIDGGSTDIGLESTVVRVVDGKVKILRPGKISSEDFIAHGFLVELDKNVFRNVNDGDKVMSPGMKYRHYAPLKKCLLIYSDDNNKLIKEILKYENALVVCRSSNVKFFKNTIDMGESLENISHNIFHILREVDKTNFDLVIIEGVKKEGLGVAIMNRLIRACSYNYIEL